MSRHPMKDVYEEFLQEKGYTECFPKKDARILFNLNEKGEVSEFVVVEFLSWEDQQHLYEKFKKDYGNCNSCWEDVTLDNVIKKFYISCGVKFEYRIDVFLELSKIKEWRSEISSWIYWYYN